jgi:hypothetical protein
MYANHYGPGVISSISDDLSGFLFDPDKGNKGKDQRVLWEAFF